MRGVEEPLLQESLRVEGGATQSEGAIETQEARYPRLHKTLSENLSMRLEERRTSPRMGLSMYPFSKEMRPLREPNTTKKSVDYFRLPRPLWRKLKKCLPNKRNNTRPGGRPRASDRAVMDAQIGTCCGAAANGRPSTAIGSG